jgi:hypothetical protein
MTDDTSPDDADAIVRSSWDQMTKPSVELINTIATVTNQKPSEMAPLYRYVEVDALDALLTDASPGANLQVSFDYDDLRVTIRSTGTIEVDTSDYY